MRILTAFIVLGFATPAFADRVTEARSNIVLPKPDKSWQSHILFNPDHVKPSSKPSKSKK